jgi:hypothetical protein
MYSDPALTSGHLILTCYNNKPAFLNTNQYVAIQYLHVAIYNLYIGINNLQMAINNIYIVVLDSFFSILNYKSRAITYL